MSNFLSSLAHLVHQDLNSTLRTSIVDLLTLEVHSQDIADELIAGKVSDVIDFQWQKRIQYI
jgi:translation initiation factor 6 (eIF-6)